MPADRKKTTRPPTPWWLSSGEEDCSHCGQIYAYELEFRCPDCDAPCCPQCRKRSAEGRNVCPECVAGCSEMEGVARG
jgi:hypothetical protein